MSSTPKAARRLATRASYTRTSGDMLLNDLGPSGQPWVSWIGIDNGGGATAIGPNGPYAGKAQPVVIRATALITGPITAAPFRVVDPAALGRPQVTPRWLTDPMLTRPDSRFGVDAAPAVLKQTRAGFWADWLRAAIWFGHGPLLTAVDAAGAPVAGSMRLIHPLLLETDRHPDDGSLRWVIAADGTSDRVWFERDGSLLLGSTLYRLVVLRNPHSPIDCEGRSKGVFELAPRTFNLGDQVDEYASGTFRSGIPAGYLRSNAPGMTQTKADALKAKWLANHGGDRRSIAVLNATTEFVPLNLSPVDAELAAMKRIAIADAAMAFGIDPMTLGAGLQNSSTYANIQDAWAQHRDFGLSLYVAAVQDTLSALLAGTAEVRADLDAFANPKAADRYSAYKTAIDAKILDVDEVRAMEGLPPRAAPAPQADPMQDLADDEQDEIEGQETPPRLRLAAGQEGDHES